MRERALDEFESIFEQASIPVLEIKPVPLSRVSAVLNGDVLDETILGLGNHLADRFDASLEVHHPATVNVDVVRPATRRTGQESRAQAFHTTEELVGQLSIARSQLVLFPESPSKVHRIVDLDHLVQGTRPPVLIVRMPLDDPPELFRSILHSLTGNFQQTQNFSYSFTLAPRGSRLLLLHTIDQSEIDDVRNALHVSADIADQTGDALLETLTHHGERFLKAVVAAGKDRPFDVNYRLAVGDVVTAVRGALETGSFSLLVVGAHRNGYSYVSAADYQLMHLVDDIPVLAL